MNAYDQIISKQIEWAKNKGLQLVGSRGDHKEIIWHFSSHGSSVTVTVIYELRFLKSQIVNLNQKSHYIPLRFPLRPLR